MPSFVWLLLLILLFPILGGLLSIWDGAINIPEALFHPHLIRDNNQEGIARQTHDCIVKCDPDIRMDLFKYIVLSGGCTMFPGMKDRMKKEI